MSITWDNVPTGGDMGNAVRTPAKESSTDIDLGTQSADQGVFTMATDGREPSRAGPILRVVYIVVSSLTILLSIVLMAVAVSAAIATKSYSVQQSGRLVAMVLLAVTAAATISVVVYAIMGVVKKRVKPLQTTAVALLILLLIQAIICSTAVVLTVNDEINLSRALADSFNLAREENARYVKLWAATQSDLSCCGVYGSEDYRTSGMPLYFPPDVPISCCPSYQPSRSALLQEREREECKARREYYTLGCQMPVLILFQDTSRIVLGCTIVFIIAEAVLIVLGFILSRLHQHQKRPVEQNTQKVEATPTPASTNSQKTTVVQLNK